MHLTQRVLLADDDDAMTATLSEWLKLQGFTVELAQDGAETMERLATGQYDAIVLDWEMPFMNGLEICEKFRAAGGMTPILILTGKSAVEQKEQGLDAGADDYLTKPFHFKEITARLRALLRRPTQIITDQIQIRDIVLNPKTKKVTKDEREISLQPMEYAVLEFLMKHPNEYFSPDHLLRRLWDSDAEVSHDAIYSCIKRVRKKLEVNEARPLITSQYGVGYRLEP